MTTGALLTSTLMLLGFAGPRLSLLARLPAGLIARPVGARSLPVVAAQQGLSRLAAPETLGLVETIEALAGDLDWRQTYTSADFGEPFLENYGYHVCVGRRGAFISDQRRLRVLLLGPETKYPDHAHEAEELYLPLAGRAFWRSDVADWRLGPPGTWIHHPSSTGQSMRTSHEPLLAAYVWRAGDLQAKSRIGR